MRGRRKWRMAHCIRLAAAPRRWMGRVAKARRSLVAAFADGAADDSPIIVARWWSADLVDLCVSSERPRTGRLPSFTGFLVIISGSSPLFTEFYWVFRHQLGLLLTIYRVVSLLLPSFLWFFLVITCFFAVQDCVDRCVSGLPSFTGFLVNTQGFFVTFNLVFTSLYRLTWVHVVWYGVSCT